MAALVDVLDEKAADLIEAVTLACVGNAEYPLECTMKLLSASYNE